MLQVEIHSFQEEDFKETPVSLAEIFKGLELLRCQREKNRDTR